MDTSVDTLEAEAGEDPTILTGELVGRGPRMLASLSKGAFILSIGHTAPFLIALHTIVY